MNMVSSPTELGSEEVLLSIWNSSADQSVLVRGDSRARAYEPREAALSVVLPPRKSVLVSTLEAMETEDEASVSWISASHPQEPDASQVFLLLREREWGARLVAAASPGAGRSSFAMLWDFTSRVGGLAPFRRVAHFVLVPSAASGALSPLAARVRDWVAGQPWGAPSAGTASTPASEQGPA
jgi:hypothetical protein